MACQSLFTQTDFPLPFPSKKTSLFSLLTCWWSGWIARRAASGCLWQLRGRRLNVADWLLTCSWMPQAVQIFLLRKPKPTRCRSHWSHGVSTANDRVMVENKIFGMFKKMIGIDHLWSYGPGINSCWDQQAVLVHGKTSPGGTGRFWNVSTSGSL